MTVKDIKAVLTNLKDSDRLHIMLDGSDYGEIVNIVKHRGKYLACNQLESNHQLGEVVNGRETPRG